MLLDGFARLDLQRAARPSRTGAFESEDEGRTAIGDKHESLLLNEHASFARQRLRMRSKGSAFL